jgi:protein-disulfide isomerase
VTDTPKQTKNQRREEAREAARVQREKTAKRKKTLKWLIPTVASVAILAIVAGVVWAVIALQPAPKKEAGPLNMISDGILFESDGNGGVQYVATKAIAKGGDPVPTTPRDGMLNIVSYVDFSCPACKAFEATNAEYIKSLVADGQATHEVHPISILDYRGYTTDYATRANNVGACVANYSPENFLDVMAAMYEQQPSEGTAGLGNSAIVDVVTSTGLDVPEINTCITDELFTPWVGAASDRALGGPLPNTDVASVGGTPTILVNGVQYDGSLTDPSAFQAFLAQQAAAL